VIVLKNNDVDELKEIARKVRVGILEAIYRANSGHIRRFFVMCRYFNSVVF